MNRIKRFNEEPLILFNNKAEIVHISPEYTRTDDGLLITSYKEKLD